MAAESLLTASFGTASVTAITSGTDDIAIRTRQQLDRLISDTITSSVKTTPAANGGTVLVSSGGNNDVNLVISAPQGSSTAGSMSDGSGKTLSFQLPANVSLVSKALTVQSEPGATTAQKEAAAQQVVTYVSGIVDKYIPSSAATTPAAVEQKNALIAALTKALALTRGQADVNLTVRNFDFLGPNDPLNQGALEALVDGDGNFQGIDSLVGANEVLLDAGTSTGDQLFVVNLAALTSAGKTLALSNVEGATLAAAGTARVEGNAPIRITSDSMAQNVSGGGGADTLVGTGNDTLTGGAGNDVFGFSGKGHYTVTDFNKAGDMLAIEMTGVTTLDQLKAKVTGVVQNTGSITYQFGPDTSITLVGVSATDLTASMLKFTIS